MTIFKNPILSLGSFIFDDGSNPTDKTSLFFLYFLSLFNVSSVIIRITKFLFYFRIYHHSQPPSTTPQTEILCSGTSVTFKGRPSAEHFITGTTHTPVEPLGYLDVVSE